MATNKAEVVPSEIFSPESGGKVKARRAMDEMRTHGMMRLKVKYKVTLNQGHLELRSEGLRRRGSERRLMRLKP